MTSVEAVVREKAAKYGWSFKEQAKRHVTQSIQIYADLVLSHGGNDFAVGDAKYENIYQSARLSDIYQLLAYCVALGLLRGLLTYAGNYTLHEEVDDKAEESGVYWYQPIGITSRRTGANAKGSVATNRSRNIEVKG